MPDSAEKTTQNLVNEIEVWDLHRPHVPKSVLRSGLGSVSAMVCAPAPDADILWATHKDHALLAQHDLAHDAQRPLENVAKAAVTWSPMGELAFVHALQSQHQDCPM